MPQEIRAIFENGLFRPLEPVTVSDRTLVSLVVSPASTPAGVGDLEAKRRRLAMQAALAAAAQLPLESPLDGFGGGRHDEVLYGWKK
jgi:predicted DNA-binding antitoxin AbrB/MazE fold protein